MNLFLQNEILRNRAELCQFLFSMSPHAFAGHLFVSTLRSETGSLPTDGALANHHYASQIVQEECLQAVCIIATYTLTRLENTTTTTQR